MASDPTFRKPLPEETLRDVKQDALERLSDQARKFGVEPNQRAHEDFVAPIVEKINRDHDNLLRQGLDPLAPKLPQLADEYEREVRDRGEVIGRGKSVTAGAYDFATDTFVATEKGAELLAERRKPESLNMRAIRRVLQRIRDEEQFAEPWRRLLMAIMNRALPPGHQTLQCRGCGARVCIIRETAMRAVVVRWMEKHGDPRAELLKEDAGAAARAKKVYVHG